MTDMPRVVERRWKENGPGVGKGAEPGALIVRGCLGRSLRGQYFA